MIDLLRKRYPAPKWVVVTEVYDDTTARSRGRCDAMAMGTWESVGVELHGFEYKNSRGDFLNEIRDPDKAERFKAYCDRWWLVAPRKVCRKDELPPGWGWLVPRGEKLSVSVGAPKLLPAKMPRGMLAMLLRRAAEGPAKTREEIRQDIWHDAHEAGRQFERDSAEGKATIAAHEDARASEVLDAVSDELGVRLTRYNVPKILRLAAALQSVGVDDAARRLHSMSGEIQQIVKTFAAAEERIDDLFGPSERDLGNLLKF